MKFFTVLATLVAASAAIAVPQNKRRTECLSQADAETLVDQYASVLAHLPDVATANATANSILADNYDEISDSILSLEGQPLGGITFAGKQVYIGGVLGAPPVEGINTIETLVAGCDKVLWHWNFTGIGSGQYEVKGFNLFDINAANQIELARIEFNSVAWALDTGYQVIFPTSS